MQNSRKQKKRKKREREQRAKRAQLIQARHPQRRRSRATLYPNVFVAESSESPPGLLALVKAALREITLSDSMQFHRIQRAFFRLQRQVGVEAALETIKAEGSLGSEDWPRLELVLRSSVGTRLFNVLRERGLHFFIPFTALRVQPVGKHYAVVIESLSKRPTRRGSIYVSRHQPTLTLAGEQHPLGWTVHAIQRVCERVVPHWRTHVGLAEAFAFFDRCLYFEPCTLPNGDPAFTFYEQRDRDSFKPCLLRKALGAEAAAPGGPVYTRVGYCPVSADDGYYVAKTILLPGYLNTPEFEVLRRVSRSPSSRRRLCRRARQGELAAKIRSGDQHLLALFQRRGLDSIYQFETALYADPGTPRLNRLRAG